MKAFIEMATNVCQRTRFAKVGSFYPLRENFRLTPEAKTKFTEKLRSDLVVFSGSKVAHGGRTDALKLVLADDRGFAAGSWAQSLSCAFTARHVSGKTSAS